MNLPVQVAKDQAAVGLAATLAEAQPVCRLGNSSRTGSSNLSTGAMWVQDAGRLPVMDGPDQRKSDCLHQFYAPIGCKPRKLPSSQLSGEEDSRSANFKPKKKHNQQKSNPVSDQEKEWHRAWCNGEI